MKPNQQILSELARAKALFQARTIAAAMGISPESVKMAKPESASGSSVSRAATAALTQLNPDEEKKEGI